MAHLDSHAAALVCPGCGHENIRTIGWIKANGLLHCGGCGNDITLQRDNLLPELEKAEKAIDGFLDEVKRMGKSR